MTRIFRKKTIYSLRNRLTISVSLLLLSCVQYFRFCNLKIDFNGSVLLQRFNPNNHTSYNTLLLVISVFMFNILSDGDE